MSNISPHHPDDGESKDQADPSDDVLTALQNKRRRTIATILLAEDGELSLVTLASKLATEEDAVLPTILIELHDVHLPALTECDVLEFNDETGDVALQLPAETVRTAVELTTENRDSQ